MNVNGDSKMINMTAGHLTPTLPSVLVQGVKRGIQSLNGDRQLNELLMD